MKLRSIKGFTLIEMLIVISIIAVLVSIIIPSVNYSSNRAAAATNAANLRAVYGKLNVMKLQQPEDFETLLSGNNHGGISIGDDSFIGKLLQQLAVMRFATFTASSDGTIVLPSGVVLEALPCAKVVSYDGGFFSKNLHVAEDTPMTIVITDDYVLTFYNNYTMDNFADIADNNKLDGVVYSQFHFERDNICIQRGCHVFTYTTLWGKVITLPNCRDCLYPNPDF